MRAISASLAAIALLLAANAQAAATDSRVAAAGPQADRYVPASYVENEALPYLQCVPYARKVSGIQIYGDAWTWWDQAADRYARGNRPRVGAVMSFQPYGNMRLGHVAAVSRVIDSRTVLLRHANWSLIDGRRGQIEDNVRAVDVSENNDWSAVRVWFAPIGNLGTTQWPLNGFIYPEPVRPGKARTVIASAAPATSAATAKSQRNTSATPRTAVAQTAPVQTTAAAKPVRLASAEPAAVSPARTPSRIGSDFLKGIRPEVGSSRAPAVSRSTPAVRQLSATAPVRTAPQRSTQSAVRPVERVATAPKAVKPTPSAAKAIPARTETASAAPVRATPARKVPLSRGTTARSDDPIGRIIASRSR